MNILQTIREKVNNHRCPLTTEEKELLHELCINYEVTDGACYYYRNKINNNKRDTYEIIKSKLIRNVILGDRIPMFDVDDNIISVQYGNLEITYDTITKRIFRLRNWIGKYSFTVDENKKKWLNKKLGISANKSVKSNVKSASKGFNKGEVSNRTNRISLN